MPDAYLVTLPASGGRTMPAGADSVLVYAEDATAAKELAAARFTGDGAWAGATATALAAGADLEGYRLRCRIRDTNGAIVEDVTVTGAASDTLDLIGTAMATALNATASIANASYTGGTNVLIVAEGATDALGDHTLEVEFLPPVDDVWDDPSVPLTGFVGAITHEGAGSADLDVTLVDAAIPAHYGVFSTR